MEHTQKHTHQPSKRRLVTKWYGYVVRLKCIFFALFFLVHVITFAHAKFTHALNHKNWGVVINWYIQKRQPFRCAQHIVNTFTHATQQQQANSIYQQPQKMKREAEQRATYDCQICVFIEWNQAEISDFNLSNIASNVSSTIHILNASRLNTYYLHSTRTHAPIRHFFAQS